MPASPPRVIVTRLLPATATHLLICASRQRLLELVQWQHDETCPRAWLKDEIVKEHTVGLVATLGDKIDEDLLAVVSKDLKVVSTMSAGYDHVQVSALRSRSIKLGTTPDALTDATADIGAMLTLMATRRAGEAYRNVIEGKWPTMPWSPFLLCGSGLQGVGLRCLSAAKLGVELWADFSPFFRVVVGPFIANTPNQKTIGILGFGRIGQLTLKRLLGFSPAKALYATSRPGSPPNQDYYSLLPPNPNSAAIEPAVNILLFHPTVAPRVSSLPRARSLSAYLLSPTIFTIFIGSRTYALRASASATSIRDLAERSNILIVTCALTEQTKGLVSTEFLGWMKKGSFVINTARGPIVDNVDSLNGLSALQCNRRHGPATPKPTPDPTCRSHWDSPALPKLGR
ncbi:BZ3500_MvSof-1268-A1-R1_Chr1-3g01659 [Microbotryum saponariae]|uniref:BZ3500_MvSof-1268-A1-R1_Chr1-3g01659 protein n=1 Tax=Microbotryum saponariae TaxID=289078 RepID=A0A2X0MF15_9BASI|nr:BZ3500_MvSof-1268-A1-R1_Chr1-3g01659 [Microbotryum saponariae]SCZ94257.1 BZ3501_MvSof-1269-A2-R1_Chr1-3g01260 [Microbotryum saponariae]